jgi:hypothetical protein
MPSHELILLPNYRIKTGETGRLLPTNGAISAVIEQKLALARFCLASKGDISPP